MLKESQSIQGGVSTIMQMNLLGVHINMVMMLEKLALPVWFAQV